MTDLRKAAQEALNALLHVQPQVRGAVPQQDVEDAIDAIRAALAEPAEPVAWMVYTEDGKSVYVTDNPTDIKVEQRALPLYTAPPCRKWVGLTDEEELMIGVATGLTGVAIRMIEAALKEKNT